MANKKVSQLVSKPSVLVTDLFPIADPTTGQLFKTTISDLGTAIGSGVSSVNTLVGAVVLDTDDIQELVSPTNKWFTDTRARAALSASSPLTYNSGTGVFSIPQANGSTNGFLSSADWTTFNNKLSTATAASTYVPYTGATANVNLGLNYSLTAALIIKSGGTSTQFLKADGSIDTNTYLTTGSAASTYLALAGGTLTGALNGTSATFTGDLTLSATNPRLYFTDTDNNPDYFISNTDGTFTIYDVTNSTSRFTIGTTGNGTFGGNLTVGQIIRSGGTSSQFLKADGSVDSSTYAKRSGLTDGYLPAWSSSLLGGSLTDSFISYASNITYVAGMGLSTLNGFDIEGNYGAGTGGLKIRSYDETTGNAYIDFANTGGRMYLGLNRSTSGGLMTNATAYATVLTTGLGTSNLEFGTNATKRVTIDGTTGAVTLTSALSGTSASFSSTLGATIGTFSNYISVGGTSGLNSYGTINIPTGEKMILNSYHGLELKTSGGVGSGTPISVFNVSSAGAATFSSSVTADGNLTLTNNRSVILSNPGTAAGSLVFFNATSGTVRSGLGSFYNVADQGNLEFLTGGTTTRMIITSSGNVGIGTTSPDQKLTIQAQGSNNGLISFKSAAGTTTSFVGVPNANGDIISSSTTADLCFRNETGNMLFQTYGSERMRITGGGDIQLNSAGMLYSTSNVISIPSTATTIFSSTGYGGVWLVTYAVSGNPAQIGYAIVGNVFGSTLTVLASSAGSQTALSVSGLNLQLLQTGGGSINTRINVIRLNTTYT